MTLRVVSLFCGMGAADYALYRAANDLGVSVEVVDAIDNWPRAVSVYNANLHPVARVADVKTMTLTDLPPHDLVIGGPPCQPFSIAGKRQGHDDPRNCLPDFLRLSAGSPYVMENVCPRLINAPWSEKLCAADFGDVTIRKRWFYSNYLLHVVKTPGLRRIRDIRDHDEDERVLRKRGLRCKAGDHGHYIDTLDTLATLTAHDIRGGGKLLQIITHRPRTNAQGCEPYATVADPDVYFGSLTSDAPWAYSGHTLRLGLRGNSVTVTATAFDDDEHLGSILSNSFHGNEESKLVGCRNPSLLEMARAHSIPNSWDWVGVTKTDRGKMIANSWPIGMGTAVLSTMLSALIAEREQVA